MSLNGSDVFGSAVCDTKVLSKLKEIIKDVSTCFTCKCLLNKDNPRRFDSIEVVRVTDFSGVKYTDCNDSIFRIMDMDLEELTMLEESGIKVIVPNKLLKVD